MTYVKPAQCTWQRQGSLVISIPEDWYSSSILRCFRRKSSNQNKSVTLGFCALIPRRRSDLGTKAVLVAPYRLQEVAPRNVGCTTTRKTNHVHQKCTQYLCLDRHVGRGSLDRQSGKYLQMVRVKIPPRSAEERAIPIAAQDSSEYRQLTLDAPP